MKTKPKPDISQLSEEELRNELVSREIDRRIQANVALEQTFEFVLQNVDTLLALTPKHERTSCADDHPNNYACGSHGEPRCNRCALLNIKENKYNTDMIVQVSLRVAEREATERDDVRRAMFPGATWTT